MEPPPAREIVPGAVEVIVKKEPNEEVLTPEEELQRFVLRRDNLRQKLRDASRLVRNARRRTNYVSKPRTPPWVKLGQDETIYRRNQAEKRRVYKQKWRQRKKQKSKIGTSSSQPLETSSTLSQPEFLRDQPLQKKTLQN